MLLLTTAALPQLEQHRHPNLGRLITPRHYARLEDTLAAGAARSRSITIAFRASTGGGVSHAPARSMPWPSRGARIRRAWPMLAVAAKPCSGLRNCRGRIRGCCGWPSRTSWATPTRRSSCSGSAAWLCHRRSPMCFRTGATVPAGCPWVRPGWPRCSSAAAPTGSWVPTPPRLVEKHAGADCWPTWAGRSTARRIRYAQSSAATSFDSSRFEPLAHPAARRRPGPGQPALNRLRLIP